MSGGSKAGGRSLGRLESERTPSRRRTACRRKTAASPRAPAPPRRVTLSAGALGGRARADLRHPGAGRGCATWLAGKRVLMRSEEHTSELQSPYDLVCRLLLEKKKQKT